MSGNYTSSRLKEAMLETLIKRLDGGDPLTDSDGNVVLDESGEVLRGPVPAGVLQAANTFLKTFPPEGGALHAEDQSETIKRYEQKMPFKAG